MNSRIVDASSQAQPQEKSKGSFVASAFAHRGNIQLRLGAFVLVAAILCILYMTIFIDARIVEYTLKLRGTKMLAIVMAAFCIGTASIVFQSIIHNRIVTPCLLGMNALYILVHTTLMFALGASSIFVSNASVAFVLDVAVMGLIGSLVYGFLLRKTNYNILYVLLAGTVMATLFSSISDTMARLLDPNNYEVLMTSLVAGFDHVNTEIFIIAGALMILTIIIFRKDLLLLDAFTLGRTQAINLGIDYDRTMNRLLVAVVFYITIATALVGPISFLGLITANIAREAFKTYKHSYLMIASFLVAIVVLTFGQILVEHVFSFGAVVTTFVSFFGGIYFMYLLVSQSKGAL